jgi:hypothetical protein
LYNSPGFENPFRPSLHWLSLSALIRIKALTSYLSASVIGIGAGLAGYAVQALGVMPSLATFLPPSSPIDLASLNDSIVATTLVVFALALSLTLNRFGLRRCWRWILVSVVAVCGIGAAGLFVFNFDLVPIPLLFSGGLSLLLTQINRLWFLDRQLARALFHSSAGPNNSIGANARLLSGLKLLNTVLPLSEAVVFRYDETDSLQPVARFKGAGPNSQDPRRNSVWREGIDLCQRAVASGKLESQTSSGTNVAVPLLHESETAGVLLIRLASELSVDDASLLEAVGSQFARNLERESFSQNQAGSQSRS